MPCTLVIVYSQLWEKCENRWILSLVLSDQISLYHMFSMSILCVAFLA